MEIVGAKENPDLMDIGSDIAGYGGGVIGGVAGLELVNNELVARQVPKVAVAILDALIAGAGFAVGAGQSGFVRKLAIGFGAAASAEALSTSIEVLQGV